jgi:LPXTG-motif cell wall-anchored protein
MNFFEWLIHGSTSSKLLMVIGALALLVVMLYFTLRKPQ